MAKHEWRPFMDARAWAREQGAHSEKQWRELFENGTPPNDIPKNPHNVYRSQWTSWGDFLGTRRVASQNRRYRSFKAAREWARAQGIKSQTEWYRFSREKRLPEDVPSNVYLVYKDDWTDWGDFLVVLQ